LLKDPYDILGLDPGASADDIKKAYRRLARERHPDSDPGNPWAEEEFKDLTQAYGILSDPKTRAQYDRGDIDLSGARRAADSYRRAGAGSAGRQQSHSGPTGHKSSGRTIKVDGADVEYDLTVTFTEAARGAVKHVSMTNGKRLKVTIPPRTRDGALLRLKGQGIPGVGGGRDGDALVEITVQSDPTFRVEETDIHVDLAVSLPEAVLGARVDAPTIDGPVSVTVPPNSNTGTILRLKGKGLSKGGKDAERGDQYVTLKVVLPRTPDAEFTEFVKRKWGEKPDEKSGEKSRGAYTVRPDIKKG